MEDTAKCFVYTGMPKSASQAEATLNSDKIKPIALVVVGLRLSEEISQSAVTYLVPDG